MLNKQLAAARAHEEIATLQRDFVKELWANPPADSVVVVTDFGVIDMEVPVSSDQTIKDGSIVPCCTF